MNKEEDTCVLYYNNHKAASERKKRRDLMRYVYSKDDFKATYFVHADGEKKNGSVAALFNFLDTKSPIETIGKISCSENGKTGQVNKKFCLSSLKKKK